MSDIGNSRVEDILEAGIEGERFSNTGGTFTGTPVIDTTYYTDHEPVG